ncbi:MAG: hypothetical protein Q6362_003645 [Candidatus Wukongarchaeota archaeon]|nr:hypothetical protein [Candidatus Wukongarchaeota archaeon]MDO8128525.1 hypothetical protein [Candidatus Wukongarchaeota archaeon]
MQMMDPEKVKKQLHMMMLLAVIFWIIRLLMVSIAYYRQFLGKFTDIDDSVTSKELITLELGAIGFILVGVFWTLFIICKLLTMMLGRMSQVLAKGKQ